jgi:hypothetical protein
MPIFAENTVGQRGDYFLAVKENQPTLLRDIEAVFAPDAVISPLPTAPA